MKPCFVTFINRRKGGIDGNLDWPLSLLFQSGTTNPTVKLFYVDLEKVIQGNTNLTEIEHPNKLSTEERILSAVAFPTDNLVYATWMNRVQNRAYFHFCYVHGHLPNCTTVCIYIYLSSWHLSSNLKQYRIYTKFLVSSKSSNNNVYKDKTKQDVFLLHFKYPIALLYVYIFIFLYFSYKSSNYLDTFIC